MLQPRQDEESWRHEFVIAEKNKVDSIQCEILSGGLLHDDNNSPHLSDGQRTYRTSIDPRFWSERHSAPGNHRRGTANERPARCCGQGRTIPDRGSERCLWAT